MHQTSPPDFGYKVPPKRILWKSSFVITAIVMVFFMWQCGAALITARRLANGAVRHFHEELNNGRYDEIVREADEGFASDTGSPNFLQAVHNKLGNATVEKQANIVVNVNAGRTLITTEYNTTFAHGSATETFTWIKKGDALKLYGYNIQSNAFIVN